MAAHYVTNVNLSFKQLATAAKNPL